MLNKDCSSYGSFDAKKRERGNSAAYTAVILIGNTCTITAISLPAAIASLGGWLHGLAAIILCVAMNCHVNILVWRLYMSFPGHKHYGELIEAAFERAPIQQRKAAVFLTQLTTYAYIFVGTGYSLLCIGQALGWMFSELHVCLPWLMFAGTIATIALQTFVRSYASLQYLLWANVLSVVSLVLVPLIYFASVGLEESRVSGGRVTPLGATSLASQLEGFSTLVLILTTQYLVVEIVSEMDNPSDYPKAACMQAPPFQFLFVALAGLGGYYFLGNEGSENLPDYLPFGLALRLTAAFFMFSAMSNNIINGIPLCKLLHKAVDPQSYEDGSPRDWSCWSAVVTAMLLSAWFVANLIPFIKDFGNLLGTSFGPACCFLVPILTYVRVYLDFGTQRLPRISRAEWALIAIWFLVSMLLISYGTGTVMVNIHEKWSTYGAPFDCNCHRLWNTCECSSMRPNMDQCAKTIF